MRAVFRSPLGQTILGPGALTIGRTPDNLLVVADPKSSSHHAVINLGTQGYSFTDLGSTNGTFINEQRLDTNVPRLLYPGDRVRIGDTIYIYEEVDVQQEASASSPTLAAGPYGYTEYGGPGAVHQAPPQQPYAPPSSYPPQPSSPSYPPQPSSPSYPPQPSSPSYPPQPSSPSYPPQPSSPSYPPIQQQPYAPPQQFYASASSPQQAYLPPPPAQPLYLPPPVQPMQPAYQPGAQISYIPPPSTPPKVNSGLRILLIVLSIVVVLGLIGGSVAVYMLTRPQPTISVTSDYKVGNVYAGSTGTVIHVQGHRFANNSAVTFLLDGNSMPGTQSPQSDANGNVAADLTVTGDWSVKNHTLTGKDGSGDVTQNGAIIAIVPQGQANTPGPNGAPPDDKSFTLKVTVLAANGTTLGTVVLAVTGKPDPAGGAVCGTSDDGQQHTSNGDAGNGVTYRETTAWTCNGTYKGGKLSYIETATSDTVAFSNGISCAATVPYTAGKLDGAFTNSTAISGTYTSDAVTANCNIGGSHQGTPKNGSWSGQI